MAPPPLRILEGLFGMLDHRVLVVLCEADIPDLLTKPIKIDDLARRINADPVRLERVLRFASTRGWLKLDRRGRVRPTRITKFLRRDHPGGWRAWVDFAGGTEVTDAVASLSLDGTDAFATANGAPFFGWMAQHPDRWTIFDQAMAAGARMHALTIDAAFEWGSVGTVCDVGGGTGDLLVGLLELEPDLNGIVFDLPEVVARARPHPRLEAIGGDAFVFVPAGCDVYLLVNVIHDWNDDDATAILRSVATAVADHARVVVVDNDHPRHPRADVASSSDLLMAALTNGGRERDGAQLARMASQAGLHLTESTRLASGDFAYQFSTRPPDSPRS